MKRRFTIAAVFAAVLFWSLPAQAQNRTSFAGNYNAIDYAYGIAPFPAALTVYQGTTATGAQTITLTTSCVALGSGAQLCPFGGSVLPPMTIGSAAGSNIETVTPTSASNCSYPVTYGCTVTATFSYTHGVGDLITSGSFGLQEAVNAAFGVGGGTVTIDGRWTQIGGTNTTIGSASPYYSVYLIDNRGLSSKFWGMQPSTLTVIAVPTTLTATNIVFTSATGTWANSSTHFSATCVDALGGESAQSLDYTQTPTSDYTLTVPVPPTCSTGAVGWRLYAGTTSLATSYLLPATGCSAQSTLTWLPSCALTATGTWAATFVTTTQLAPGALGVTNTNNPVPQGHTTFAYQPSNTVPEVFQTHYGPFGSGAVSSATAGDTTVLGTIELPTGYLNTIGRSIRVSGKIVGGATTTGYIAVKAGIVWAGGVTAGAPVATCTITNVNNAFTTGTWEIPFSCTMTTNAVGATAVGSVMPDGWAIETSSAALGMAMADTGTAVVGSLGLFSQDAMYIWITPTTEAFTATQLIDLHVETLQ